MARSPISFKHKGNFSKSRRFLSRMLDPLKLSVLHQYGRKGVEALRDATPKDDGSTAASWGYEVVRGKTGDKIIWTTSGDFTRNGTPVVILLQYGHGTRAGTYVEGIDFINPALKPIFDQLSEEIRKEMEK